MLSTLPIIGFVVPCYNEEEILIESSIKLRTKLSQLVNDNLVSDKSFIAFINDGSKDKTWQLIKEEVVKDKTVKGLNLSRNIGHQKAVFAGIAAFKSAADALISIDADLQDDIEVVDQMIKQFSAGSEIVYGIREDRSSDSWFKRTTASLYYNVLNAMEVEVFKHHADFRLSSQKVNDALMHFSESNLFLRGVFPKIGFNHSFVYYNRLERTAGESKYPLRKMLQLAWDGITSFSSYPLKLVFRAGIIMFVFGLLLSVYALWSFLAGNTIPGWASTVLPLYFLGAVQLLCVGVLGEYIGKIYIEVKNRPNYFVDEVLESEKNNP